MKAKQLGAVTFEYPQEVLRECSVKGEKVRSASGTNIIFESILYTPDITLSSAEDDWLSLQNVEDLSVMCEQIDTTFTLTYEDDTTEEVMFDHSKSVSFSEIQTGVCFYYGNIPLVKVA